MALSDGMGSGEEAFKESTMVVEMLEELLEAGFPVKMAIQMMNTALVIGREDVRFSTIDAAIFDLYTGECEFVKAGASATFVKQNGKVEKISSTTLPIGVLQDIEIQTDTRVLSSGDYVIMVTDGSDGCTSCRRAGCSDVCIHRRNRYCEPERTGALSSRKGVGAKRRKSRR